MSAWTAIIFLVLVLCSDWTLRSKRVSVGVVIPEFATSAKTPSLVGALNSIGISQAACDWNMTGSARAACRSVIERKS